MTTGGPPMNLGPNVKSSFNERSPVLSVLARTCLALGCQDGEPPKSAALAMRSPTRCWSGIRSSILLANSRFCYLSPLDLMGPLPVSPLNGSLPAVSDLHRHANHLSLSDSNRLLAVLNIAMADTAFTTWSGKRFYGSVPFEVTWRPVTSIPMADTAGNPDTDPDPEWLPLINTPSHPEYPAGHPSLNGAAATIPPRYFRRNPPFTLTTTGLPNRTYTSIAQARSDGNNARVWGGMHYPSTVKISDAEGEAIANYVNLNSMHRFHPWIEDDEDD